MDLTQKQYTFDEILTENEDGYVVGKEFIDDGGTTWVVIASRICNLSFVKEVGLHIQFKLFSKPPSSTDSIDNNYVFVKTIDRYVKDGRCCDQYGVTATKEEALDENGQIKAGYFNETWFFNQYVIKPALYPFIVPTIDRVFDQLKNQNYMEIPNYL